MGRLRVVPLRFLGDLRGVREQHEYEEIPEPFEELELFLYLSLCLRLLLRRSRMYAATTFLHGASFVGVRQREGSYF